MVNGKEQFPKGGPFFDANGEQTEWSMGEGL